MPPVRVLSAVLFVALFSSGAVWGCIPTVTPDDMYDDEYLQEEVRKSVLLTTARLAPTETSPASAAPTTSTTTLATSTTSTSTSTTTTTTPIPTNCPTNPTPWTLNPLTGICYYRVTTPAIWQNAEMECGNLDPSAHLASVNSQEENDFIFNTVIPAGDMSYYWLGLQQLANTNTFLTMGMWSDGSPYDYTGYSNWYAGTPPAMTTSDGCAYIHGHYGAAYDSKWTHSDCVFNGPYICEVPAT